MSVRCAKPVGDPADAMVAIDMAMFAASQPWAGAQAIAAVGAP